MCQSKNNREKTAENSTNLSFQPENLVMPVQTRSSSRRQASTAFRHAERRRPVVKERSPSSEKMTPEKYRTSRRGRGSRGRQIRWTAPRPLGIEDEPLPADIDGEIDVLQRKIKAGLNVEAHQRMLERAYERRREIPDIRAGEPAGLSDDVYKRMHTLKLMLAESSVGPNYRVNILAVLEKYRSGELEVTPGFVTYWVKGEQLSEPKPKNLDETVRLAHEHDSEKGYFWVEDPRRKQHMAHVCFPPEDEESPHHNILLSIRLPGSVGQGIDVEVLDDTGSSDLAVFSRDILNLEAMQDGGRFVDEGFVMVQSSNGVVMLQKTVLEVNFKYAHLPHQVRSNHKGPFFGGWYKVESSLLGPLGSKRLSGSFMRDFFYTGTVPDGRGLMYVSTNRSGLAKAMPAVDHLDIVDVTPPGGWGHFIVNP